MKKITLILGIFIAIILTIIIILASTSVQIDEPFNQIELTQNNSVLNSTNERYYDTILSVGLDAAGLKGINVNVLDLSDISKNQFEGELKAHIRYFNGDFYLFIDKFDRSDAIEVIAHEIVHIHQYNTSDLIYESGTTVYWLGVEYDVANLEYDRRPWERDAFDRQGIIDQTIRRTLYSK